MNKEVYLPSRSRKKDTLWNLVFSYSTIAYAILSGLVLVPFYLRYIPIELYGAWLATGNIVSWILVIDSGISVVVLQKIGQSFGANDLKSAGEYAVAGILMTIVIISAVLVVGFLCSLHVVKWVHFFENPLAADLQINFFFAVIAAASTFLAYTISGVNQGLLGSFANGFSFFIANTLSLLSTAILLFLGAGLYSISIGMMVRGGVFLASSLAYMLWRFRQDNISFAFNKKRVKELSGVISIASMGRVGSVLSKNMHSFLLARFIGAESVPVFVLTGRGLSVAEMFLARLGNAISPSLSHLSGEKNQGKIRSIIVRVLKLNVWLLGIAFGGFLALNDDFVRLWVGKAFFAGEQISHLLCVLLVFTVLITLMQTICMALGDIKRNSIVWFIEALVTFVCFLLGIYWFGMLGAALAPLVGLISVSIGYYPRSLGRLASLSRSDWWQLGREAVVAFALGTLVFLLFFKIIISSWMMLILCTLCAIVLYGVLLIIVSRPARSELMGLFLQARIRMN